MASLHCAECLLSTKCLPVSLIPSRELTALGMSHHAHFTGEDAGEKAEASCLEFMELETSGQSPTLPCLNFLGKLQLCQVVIHFSCTGTFSVLSFECSHHFGGVSHLFCVVGQSGKHKAGDVMV